MVDRFRTGRQSPVNIWAESDDEPDVQWAMARTDAMASELVRLANLGLEAERNAQNAADAHSATITVSWSPSASLGDTAAIRGVLEAVCEELAEALHRDAADISLSFDSGRAVDGGE